MPHDCVDIVNHSYLITKRTKLIQSAKKYYSNKLVLVVYIVAISNFIIIIILKFSEYPSMELLLRELL